MPGKKITDQQVKLYMKNRKEYSQAASAAKAGFSERSARNIERRGNKPAKTTRDWKTREDPLENIWEKDLVLLLKIKIVNDRADKERYAK